MGAGSDPKPEQPAGVAEDGRGGSNSEEEKHPDVAADGGASHGDSEEEKHPDVADDGRASHGDSEEEKHQDVAADGGASHGDSQEDSEEKKQPGAARAKNGGPCHGDGMAELSVLAGGSTTAARIELIRHVSQRFAESAAGTSMATESVLFLKAVEEFDAVKDGKKKVMETDLSKTGRLLWDAACRAPPSEAAVAAVAMKVTGYSLDILLSLSSEERGSRPCAFLAWLQRLRAARREPTLPLHRVRHRQDKLSDKRQALFGVALAAPLALLASATSERFPSGMALWIAGISAAIWIGISCALVMDLFGDSKLESRLASCLGRLGMMGVTILVCLFISGAFFPSTMTAMWALLAFTVILHTLLCVSNCMRGGADCEANTEMTRAAVAPASAV